MTKWWVVDVWVGGCMLTGCCGIPAVLYWKSVGVTGTYTSFVFLTDECSRQCSRLYGTSFWDGALIQNDVGLVYSVGTLSHPSFGCGESGLCKPSNNGK